jgi:hypothetical protein
MLYDENEDGEIIDIKYIHDTPITRYKLVCESDVDVSSLALASEVVSLLHEYKLLLEGRKPQNDFEVLMQRIISLSGPDRRPLEVVIGEHLVGTTDADPAIKNNL